MIDHPSIRMQRENRFPTAAEKEAMLSGIQDKITKLGLLRRAAEELSREIELDRFFIATHRRLPAEILAEIFMFCGAYANNDWMAPLVISHVSHYWREIVIHTPQAWSVLSIKISPRSSPYDITRYWIRRSGLCPLAITFETTDWVQTATSVGTQCGSLAGVLNILRPHTPRWRRVQIIIHTGLKTSRWDVESVLNQFNFPMPALEDFDLVTPPASWQDYRALAFSVPLLKSARIGSFRPSIENHWLPQITKLELHEYAHPIDYVHDLLEACVLLEHLTLNIKSQGDLPRMDLTPVQLPRLQHISVADIAFISFLQFPVLDSFKCESLISLGSHEGFMTISLLRVLCVSSGNTCLREISFVNIDIGPFGMSYLKDLPTIEILRVKNSGITDHTLDSLKNLALCPRLHTIQLITCHAIIFPLVEVVRIRNSSDSLIDPIQRIDLFDCANLSEGTMSGLVAADPTVHVRCQ